MDLRQEIIIALTEAKDEIIANIDSKMIRASGRTQQSLQVEDRGGHIVLVDKGEGAPFESLQYGREPGKVPYGFDAIIHQWLIDKRIATTDILYKRKPSANWQPKYTPKERGMMSAAGAIAEKIKKKGTYRFSEPNENVYTPVLNELIEKIEKIMLTKITSEIRK